MARVKSQIKAVSLSDIRSHNHREGYHFFDACTMRFFNSRVRSSVYIGGYFITSERPDSRRERFTVRQYDPATGAINTCGEFHQFSEIWQARAEIRRLQAVAK